MKFARLRLLGFKSFVDASDFVIEPGLTAVVGPNGCGKSNLVEALRWVMGESSYKNMRASGMEDVIFSGSAARVARNSAEVTLFLDNAARRAPAGFNEADEIQVSRRIEREAGSTYRINGREARARDVQLLFADQSTGARSPSMVGQGRIGELIQAKPQARRALLEEAAGISGLHARRHEAEARLRAAESNLDRLDDVVGTLQVQIESLKRQGRQAMRFKALSAEIRQAEAALLHIRWTAAKAQEAEARSALNAATLLVAERANAQIGAAREQGINLHRLPALREAQAASAAELQRLNLQKAALEGEVVRLSQRRAELARRLAQCDADLDREEALVRDHAAVLDRLAGEQRALEAAEEGAGVREAEAALSVEKAEERLSLSEGAATQLTAERAELSAARAAAERALSEAEDRCRRLEHQAGDVAREKAELGGKLSKLPDAAALRQELARREEDLRLAAEAATTVEAQAAALRSREAALRAPLGEAKAALARLEGEARALQRLLQGWVGAANAPVLDAISVEPGFERALSAALGDDLDASLSDEAPAFWGGTESSLGDPPLPNGAEPLAGRLRAPLALARRLAQVGWVEEADGPRLQPQLRPGQRLVSRSGALWRWDGFTARADAPSASAERLAQKNRLSALEAEIGQGRDGLAGLTATLAETEATVRLAAEAEGQAKAWLRESQAKVATARDALARAEEAVRAFATRMAALDEAEAFVGSTLADAVAGVDAARRRLAKASDPGTLRSRLDDAALRVASGRTALAEARARAETLKREREARRQRLATIVQERGDWTRRAREAASQIDRLRQRQAEDRSEQARLAQAPDELEQTRRELLSLLSAAEKARHAAADRLAEAETKQARLDKAAATAVQGLSEAREARARAEERLNATDGRRREAQARIRETLDGPPERAAEIAGLGLSTALPDAGDVERRLERLRAERERLGAVNLRAEDEGRELSAQLETILRERDDVIEAVKRLRQAIQGLNREGRDRLLDAYRLVGGHFQRLFTHLFGGGTAELQLIESDDPLEAGLEIVAKPPGKKPQTMTLLSGGEQALTAMALIFAVFLTNPTPICVLDEVDAPLDDHNVERFCNLLDEMVRATETRFVVITHNPITMARMDRLFGVTMAEQGVSQLVSVDLQAAERLRDAS